MTTITGDVEYVTKKPTSRGTLATFVKIKGMTYGTFGPTRDLKIGDVVSFDAEQNAKGFWNFSGLQIISEASSRPATPVPQAVSGGVPAPAPMSDQREQRITRLNATSSAIALVNSWVSTQPKNSTDLDTLLFHVIHYAKKIYDMNYNGYPSDNEIVEAPSDDFDLTK